MREAEFRAWDGKRMNYAVFVGLGKVFSITKNCKPKEEIINAIAMQWTGLFDTDGNKIFGGDILNIGSSLVGEVVYIDSNIDDTEDKISCAYHVKLSKNNKIIPFDSYIKETCLVIGNIYENKNLSEE